MGYEPSLPFHLRTGPALRLYRLLRARQASLRHRKCSSSFGCLRDASDVAVHRPAYRPNPATCGMCAGMRGSEDAVLPVRFFVRLLVALVWLLLRFVVGETPFHPLTPHRGFEFDHVFTQGRAIGICYCRPTTTIINVPGLAAGRDPGFASSNSTVGK